MGDEASYIGIDPGLTGAMAILEGSSLRATVIPFSSLRDYYERLRDIDFTGDSGVVLEAVHILPFTSSRGATTFMRHTGGIAAILECLQIPHQEIGPKRWQPACGVSIRTRQGENKNARKARIKAKSIEVASKFFGVPRESLSDGAADALHLARYARVLFSGGSYGEI